jgi:hypothetical protein
LCPNGTASLGDKTFSATFYLEIDSGELSFEGRVLFLEVWNTTNGSNERPLLKGIGAADAFQWIAVQATIDLATATHIGFSFHGLGDALGRIYVDNVVIE